ncbi:hypothetical protein ACSNN7_00745 [Micromonospora sp. URMC 105]
MTDPHLDLNFATSALVTIDVQRDFLSERRTVCPARRRSCPP